MTPFSDAALAIDIGTSSVRAIGYLSDGSAIPDLSVQQTYQPTLTADGGAFFDPIHLRDQVWACIDAVCERAIAADIHFAAVGIDTFATNLLAIDRAGQPITPIYLWNDTCSRSYVAELKADFDDHYDRSGTAYHSSYWPPRLLWLQATAPNVWANAARWLSVGEWLQGVIFGEWRCSTSLAAWTGLLNRRSGDWDVETLRRCRIAVDRLSPLSDQPFGCLPGPFADRWRPLAASTWHVARSDGYTANVGGGAIQAGTAALTIGTSGALRVLVDGVPDRVPRGLFCYRVNQTQSLLGGAVSNAGNVFAWLQQTLRLTGDPFAQIDDLTLPDSHGLTIQPNWAGERSPGWDDDARATVAGMTLDTTADDIARAALEAVLYKLADIDDLLAEVLGKRPAIMAAGGVLAGSPGWAQVTADIFGRAIAVCADAQASARGTALLALGTYAEPSINAVYAARPAFSAIYQRARQRQSYSS